VAVRIGAVPLATELERLAQRARLDLAPVDDATRRACRACRDAKVGPSPRIALITSDCHD